VRLLIVEDYLLVALALRALLQDLGHVSVGIASTPAEALRIAAEPDIMIDLALVDIRLANETSGIDAARQLGQIGVGSVFVTAYQGDVQWVEGAIGALYKPYSQQDIRGTLAACQRLMEGQPAGPIPSQFRIFNPTKERDTNG
jgi:CheY-like chemotaxis protein